MTTPMTTPYGGNDSGCAACQEDRPAVDTTFQPDGSQIRQEKCAICGKVWGIQLLTRDQAIILDTVVEASQMFAALAVAANKTSGVTRSTLEEIRLLYGPDIALLAGRVLDTIKDPMMLVSLAAAINPGSGSPGYTAVMEEISDRFGAAAAELVKQVNGAVGVAISRSHLAKYAGQTTDTD
jgi:hypothetical protein